MSSSCPQHCAGHEAVGPTSSGVDRLGRARPVGSGRISMPGALVRDEGIDQSATPGSGHETASRRGTYGESIPATGQGFEREPAPNQVVRP